MKSYIYVYDTQHILVEKASLTTYKTDSQLQIEHQKRKTPKMSVPKQNTFSDKKTPFKKLQFSGKNDPQNPKAFIENFEHTVFQTNVTGYEKNYCFADSLVDDAANWLISRGCGTYTEMKSDFLKCYWSKDIQASFLNHVKYGKYDENCGLSISDYFLHYARGATFLDKAPSQKEIIVYLSNHFDFKEEIQEEFELRSIKTIEQAVDVLKKVELSLENFCDEEIESNYINSKYRRLYHEEIQSNSVNSTSNISSIISLRWKFILRLLVEFVLAIIVSYIIFQYFRISTMSVNINSNDSINSTEFEDSKCPLRNHQKS